MIESMLVERYKYVLEQKKRLNETTFKIAAFFQAVMIVILGAQFRVVELHQRSEITYSLASVATWGLFWATLGLTCLSLLLLFGGVASWFDYRHQEVELERQLGGTERRPPSMRGFFRWYETYVALIMIIVTAGYWWSLKYIILNVLGQ